MKIILNRETEKIIFHPPAYIKFSLKVSAERGMVHFGSEAVRQMNLKIGDRVEFEIDGGEWFVMKSDNEFGYNLFLVGRKESKALAMNSNKLVRGFLSKNKVHEKEWVRCLLEKSELPGQYSYPKFKIIVSK